MLVLVFCDDHGNGDHHARYDKENLDGMCKQVKGVKQQSRGYVTRCATNVVVQTYAYCCESSETMDDGEIGLHPTNIGKGWWNLGSISRPHSLRFSKKIFVVNTLNLVFLQMNSYLEKF